MRNKKIILILIILIILIVTIGLTYYFEHKKTYNLNTPKLDEIISIALTHETSTKTISNINDLKNILEIINKTNRTTKKESIQDSPTNIKNLVKINFNFKENGTSTLFIYEKSNKYFIEQPYNGIYEITENEFNLILEYLK